MPRADPIKLQLIGSGCRLVNVNKHIATFRQGENIPFPVAIDISSFVVIQTFWKRCFIFWSVLKYIILKSQIWHHLRIIPIKNDDIQQLISIQIHVLELRRIKPTPKRAFDLFGSIKNLKSN